MWQAALGEQAGLKFGCLSGDRIWDADAAAFGYPAPAIAQADPQIRMSFEVATEALHDTGMPPSALRAGAASVGVFAAQGIPEHVSRLSSGAGAAFSKMTIAGNYSTFLSNVVSANFDFRGPSITIDTACSSSITALHLAVESLVCGSCDAALVVATNALVSPLFLRALAENGVLSATGRSLPFDAAADGFVRGEGAVAMVLVAADVGGLRPVPRVPGVTWAAVRVYAHVISTGANHDGAKIQMTEPSGAQQAALIRFALARAGVDAAAVALMDMHATGTPVGDPIESAAVSAALGAGAGRAAPLLIGSVKGNFGHLESAAGLVSEKMERGLRARAQPLPISPISHTPITASSLFPLRSRSPSAR